MLISSSVPTGLAAALSIPPRRPGGALPAAPHARSLDGSAERACAQLWGCLHPLDLHGWLAPACVPSRHRPASALCEAPGAAHIPCRQIAVEGERALMRGASAASAPALVLLAKLALERYGGGDAAQQLADAALQMAARAGGPASDAVAVLHAALFGARGARLHQATATLASLCEHGTARRNAALALAGVGMAAGMPLPALARHLDAARDAAVAHDGMHAAADELAARAALLHTLLSAREAPIAPEADAEQRLGHHLVRLQAAWFAGDTGAAREAAERALALANALTPAADLMALHLFAALAQSASAGGALDGLRRHCAALLALAGRCPAAAPMAELASALLDRRAGDPIGALRGFERADVSASRAGQHWVAALASEQAAAQACDAGLATAARHYRRQALDSWLRWGALGRVETLKRRWGAFDGAAAAQEQERIQRAETIGEIGVSIAHEVNQPLAAIALHAAAARKWLRRAEPDLERALASLSLVSAAGRQAGEIVRSVHRLAARQDKEFAAVALDDAVAEALHLLARPLRRNGVELELALGLPGCTLRADRVQVQQVVTNLVVNAMEALAGRGNDEGARRIRVSTARYNACEVEIAVADNGPGIAPANRARVFGRLFSTKPDSTGMGLSISLAIARAHGGQLLFEPCEPHGACFRLRLPHPAAPAT